MQLFTFVDITAAFTAVMGALAAIVAWSKNTIFQLGTISVSVFDLAVGALVIGTIIKEFVPWSDDDEDSVLWED